MGASQFEGLLGDGTEQKERISNSLKRTLALFEPSQFCRLRGPTSRRRDWPTTPAVYRIRRVHNRDDFYDPGPLTSSPTPIPSGVLCGDNSSLSYIVARRCRACAVCARLSCRIPLRSGLRTRCGVSFLYQTASQSNQNALLIAFVFVRLNLTFMSGRIALPGRFERIISHKVVDTNSVFITVLLVCHPYLLGEAKTSFE